MIFKSDAPSPFVLIVGPMAERAVAVEADDDQVCVIFDDGTASWYGRETGDYTAAKVLEELRTVVPGAWVILPLWGQSGAWGAYLVSAWEVHPDDAEAIELRGIAEEVKANPGGRIVFREIDQRRMGKMTVSAALLAAARGYCFPNRRAQRAWGNGGME